LPESANIITWIGRWLSLLSGFAVPKPSAILEPAAVEEFFSSVAD
jgi:hypothetical protein